ncbi:MULTISPECIES: hypothetical protein [Kocuria]|uniref:Uncharacterized protein n=1 Tax=Kocuria subflava TaxID=1736139 RepID=A0A846TSX8_9MICC|nr:MULTISPECIES: hypothetical protein [Kocuria]NKE10080.1 hypothetical protein [Kocuria subflava]
MQDAPEAPHDPIPPGARIAPHAFLKSYAQPRPSPLALQAAELLRLADGPVPAARSALNLWSA